jgi:hypothetical protein
MTARSFFRSRPWRTLRWAGLAMAVPALWACNSRSLEAPTVMPTRTFMNTFQETLNRKIDILFMIDNSSSMENSQANLQANFPRFMDVLKALPDGLPDLHLAVVSSDMGVGHSDIPGCNASGGDNGIFRFGVGSSPLNTCTATGLNPDAHYISSTGGANPQANFTGDITQVFQCIAPIGATGCGFEQQLRSMARSLGADGFQPPAENQGFLRPEAYLGIIFITNEDDCSAANNGFYDVATNTNMASPLGPPGNFRCAEFGHTCTGGSPSRNSPTGAVTDTVTYENCVSSEGAGQLIPVSAFAAGVKSLKPDPASQILVASIQGPVTPYVIKWKTPGVQTDPPWPDIAHSCTLGSGTTGSFADPGVRVQQFVQEFGGNGLVYSICQDNFGPALNTIAMKLSQLIGPKCVVGQLWDKDGDGGNGSLTPDCAVIDHVPNGSGTGTVDSVVPSCADNGNTAPCWSLRAPTTMEQTSCPSGHIVAINRGGAQPPDNLRNSVSCSICIPNVADPHCGADGNN